MLEILDTAGTKQFSAMRDMYVRVAEGFVLVWSLTDASTLDDVVELHTRILRVKDTDYTPCVIAGNKCDMEEARKVSKEDFARVAEEANCAYFETSAKEGINVDETFYDLVRQINAHKPKPKKKKCIIL